MLKTEYPICAPAGNAGQETLAGAVNNRANLGVVMQMSQPHTNTNWLPFDVEQKIQADYPREPVSVIMSCLAAYEGQERVRVMRCILHLAQADVQKLLHFIGRAVSDYRDVIYWAEYDRSNGHIRDFNQPFVI